MHWVPSRSVPECPATSEKCRLGDGDVVSTHLRPTRVADGPVAPGDGVVRLSLGSACVNQRKTLCVVGRKPVLPPMFNQVDPFFPGRRLWR